MKVMPATVTVTTKIEIEHSEPCKLCGKDNPKSCKFCEQEEDAEVEETRPVCCQFCGKDWDRVGFMEWELNCSCTRPRVRNK